MAFGTALHFMLSLNFERFPHSTVSEVVLPPPKKGGGAPGANAGLGVGPDGDLQADVYRRPGGPSRGTVIVIHGMTVTGNRDPRVINLGRALAEAGFTAVAPLIPGIQDQQIRPLVYDDVALTIQRVSENPDLCPSGAVALLGPSFSGSACLIAAARPENIDRVSSICTVGPYATSFGAFDFFFHAEKPDEYGKTIVLWNFIEYAIGKNKAVLHALKLATLDNGHRRAPEECELPAHLESMKPKDRELFERLRHDHEFRLELWENKIVSHPALVEMQKSIECSPNLRPGMAPITLVHGREDDVIPPSESEALYERCKELNIPARLCITDLISHGDHGLTLAMIPQSIELAQAFGHFFKYVR
jgi:pimeloyl-ACP methyl ester carboxylesterase